MHSSPILFDRNRVKAHRARAAGRISAHDFLLSEMATRIGERLSEFRRDFAVALDLGGHHGLLQETLRARGIGRVIATDMAQALLQHTGHGGREKLVCDEEYLPFADDVFDLVVSAGSLHWVNDLPGALIQIRKSLKPGGLFLAVMPGGETLKELRQSFEQAEIAMLGGISPRVSPFIDTRDAAALLQRAGFAMPVADSEVLTAEYAHPLKLMHELRGMGEASALIEGRKHFTSCALIMAACDHYMQHFALESGRVAASFELVTLTGIKP